MPSTTRAIWQQISTHAEQVAISEPWLAPFLEESVFQFDNLEDALCRVLSELLASGSLSISQLIKLFENVRSDEPRLLHGLARDIRAVLERDPAATSPLHVLLYLKGFHAIQIHRFANHLWHAGRVELAMYLQSRSSRILQVDIHPAVQLGVGVFFDHATGIVIGETAVIEDNVSILQGVTLGGTGKDIGDRHPKIRHGVLIGAGATILGNIDIGINSRIGAGSVVLKAVEARRTVAGVPARVVGGVKEKEPAKTMNHMIFDVGL